MYVVAKELHMRLHWYIRPTTTKQPEQLRIRPSEQHHKIALDTHKNIDSDLGGTTIATLSPCQPDYLSPSFEASISTDLKQFSLPRA